MQRYLAATISPCKSSRLELTVTLPETYI